MSLQSSLIQIPALMYTSPSSVAQSIMTDTQNSDAKKLKIITSASAITDCTRHSSPVKRKRSDSSAAETAGSHIRQRADRQTGSPPRVAFGSESPRTAVSTKFSTLQLDTRQFSDSGNGQMVYGATSSTRKLDLVDSPVAREMASGEVMHFVGGDSKLSDSICTSQYPAPQTSNRPQTPQLSSRNSMTSAPATPTLLPVTSPTGAPAISPLSTAPSVSIAAAISWDSQQLPSSNQSLPVTPSGSPSKRDSTQARSSKIISEPKTHPQSPSVRVTKARARRKSPPPAAAVNDLVWSDAEITGHDPDDPNDDGYGINGIGFRPTPAMAEKRRNQRRKQIAEWRKREDTEKRSRRREMRNGSGQTVTVNTQEKTGQSPSDSKRVRFVGLESSSK